MSQAVLEAPGAVPDGDDETAKAELDGITELEAIEPDSVHGVGVPANGFPTLMLKGVDDPEAETVKADGDEADSPALADDTDSESGQDAGEDDPGRAVKTASQDDRDGYIAAVAEWKAREPVWKGRGDGTEYLQIRARWQAWQTEATEKGLDGTEDGASKWLADYVLRDDAVKMVIDAEDTAFKGLNVEKKDYSASQRRQLASEGHALSDGSYPIADASDLHNAAVLAQSGHGNVAGAKRLITRRAKELGVSNPLASAGASKDGGKCKTCNGSGKIKDGNVTCPDCKGKNADGKTDSKKAGDALAAVTKIASDAVAAGLMTREQADALIAQASDAVKATRPLPSDVKPAGTHREPDGTSTVERLEPEAGMATNPDKTADHVPASMVMGKEAVPYAVQRMHDATCAAYPADEVLACYPALKTIADAIEPAWLAQMGDDGDRGSAMAKAAETLRGMDPAAVADGRALVHKAFTDMYPSAHCSPGAPPQPGSYHRPYLTAGHAAEHAGGSPDIPPSSHVPDPSQFHRGPLTAGHQAPSPGDGPRPAVTGSRSAYGAAAKTYAEQSLKALHDHVAASYGQVCPMAATPAGLDLGARNVPHPVTPQVPGGVNTIKEGGQDMDAEQIAELTAAALIKAGAVTDAAGITSLLEAQLAPLREQYETKISELAKQVDELGSQPDPAMAPVRGTLAKVPAGTATPVEKRSLVDEAREREQAVLAARASDHAAYIGYVQKQAQSTNPQVREAAFAVLDQIGETAAKTSAAA